LHGKDYKSVSKEEKGKIIRALNFLTDYFIMYGEYGRISEKTGETLEKLIEKDFGILL
jgi:hypothetical protein